MVHSSPELGLIVAAVQSLMFRRRFAALGTIEPPENHPYASLIAVAPDADGAPVFLISKLAWHTRNLEADPRASVLLTEAAEGDPLDAGRVSLMGTAEPSNDSRVRRGFLARHPEAAAYASFKDFGFWRLRVERAHYVGGFGRIVTLGASEFLPAAAESRQWEAAAEVAIEELNARKPELIRDLAGYAGTDSAGWRIAACDPFGCDLSDGGRTRRIDFASKLNDPTALQETLSAMARCNGAESA